MPRSPIALSPATVPQVPAVSDQLVGQTLDGRLRVLRPIGHGGMGTVYVAEHVGLSKQVAVKVLNPQYAVKPEVIARLHAEARNAAAIASPHIVDIFDIGTTEGGQPYVVMELLHGESLAERLRRCTALSELDTLRIGRQLATALSAAHRSGIVHRDIKPENIFLCNRDGHDFVKLLDFGISKAVGPLNDGELSSWAEADDATHDGEPIRRGGEAGGGTVDRTAISGDFLDRLTRTGAIMGTPLYMSPEQARGDRLDLRCDIYSLGAVLYECLTGSVPYLAPSYFGVIAKILTETPEPPSLRIPDRALSSALERIVLGAMASDRTERYQTMDELLADLDRYQRGEPVRAGDPLAGRDARSHRRTELDGSLRADAGARRDGSDALMPRGAVPQVLPLLGVTIAVLLLGGLLVFWRGPHEHTSPHRAGLPTAPEPAGPAVGSRHSTRVLPPIDPTPLVPQSPRPLPALSATSRADETAPRSGAHTQPIPAAASTVPAGPAATRPTRGSTVAASRSGTSARPAGSPQPSSSTPTAASKEAGRPPTPPPLPPAFADEQAPNPFVSPASN